MYEISKTLSSLSTIKATCSRKGPGHINYRQPAVYKPHLKLKEHVITESIIICHNNNYYMTVCYLAFIYNMDVGICCNVDPRKALD